MERFTKRICKETSGRTLIVYGTGAIGEIVCYALKKWGREPDLFCDHDPDKQSFWGREVIPAERLKDYADAVVIIAFKDFLRSAIAFVVQAGISSFYSAEDLVNETIEGAALSKGAQEFLVRKNNYHDMVKKAEDTSIIALQHLEWMLTERCTLRCCDCSALIPQFKAPCDHDYLTTKIALERILAAIDYISELSILGGEPFLYPSLSEAITDFSRHPKIGAIVIYTNGTVLPNNDVLRALCSGKVWVHISDYGKYSKKLPQLKMLFSENGIRFFAKQYDCWQRAGEPALRDDSTERLIWKYQRCFKARCYSLFEDRLYGCARASNGAAAGILPDEGYVSFSEPRSVDKNRMLIRSLISAPFLEACRHCDGMIEGQSNVVPAIQAI